MKTFSRKIQAVMVLFSALFLAALGCNGPRPLAPTPNVKLSVSVAPSKDVQASLLGSTSNILLWNCHANGSAGTHGQAGPFATGSATGSVIFSVFLPAGGKNVFSVQLNDANTNSPLAVGAAQIDLSNPAANLSVTLLLGSVIRNCYVLENASSLYPYYDLTDHVCEEYSEVLGYASDTEIIQGSVNYQLSDPYSYSSIAYLGNGNLVDFDYVPPNSQFSSSSGLSKQQVLNPSAVSPTPVSTSIAAVLNAKKSPKANAGLNFDLETGDIYCIILTSQAGYAWVQVTDPGNYPSTGPSFCFRVSTDTFFSYYQTSADAGQDCSIWTVETSD